jgi:hypothetical protein
MSILSDEPNRPVASRFYVHPALVITATHLDSDARFGIWDFGIFGTFSIFPKFNPPWESTWHP